MIEFEPINEPSGGRINISIREPGEWFDSPDYHVFIGGGGIRSVIGSVKTLGEARDLTRTGIVRELTRIVANTEERRAFYQAALDAFQSIGPVEIKKEVSVVNVNGDGLIGFYDDSILLNQGTAIHDSVQELEELVLKVRTPDPDWGLFSVYELKSIDEKGYTHGRS